MDAPTHQGVHSVLCRQRRKVVARLALQAHPRLVALAQGEAGQVVGEAAVGVGLGEAGACESVLVLSVALSCLRCCNRCV